MSCFICDDVTFGRLAGYLESEASKFNTALDAAGLGLFHEINPVEFCELLRLANYKAYSDRYGNGDVSEVPRAVSKIESCSPLRTASDPTASVATYKALQAIENQCVDWKGWRRSFLSRAVTDLMAQVARTVIQAHRAYDEAPWG